MFPSFDKLIRMLTLEKRLGYNNKAVMGGLEKLAPHWLEEALQDVTSPEERSLVQEVARYLERYPQVADLARPKYIHQIMVKLHRANESRSDNVQDEPETEESGQAEPDSGSVTASSSPSSAAVAAPPPAAKPDQPARENRSAPVGEKNNGAPARDYSHRQGPSPVAKADSRTTKEFADSGLDSPVTRLPGIKEGMGQKLARLGVQRVGDLLSLYPRRYDDYRALKPINQLESNEDVTIIGQIWETRKRLSRQNRTVVTTILTDGTATIEVSWFNQPWLEKQLTPGKQIVLSGRVEQYLGRLTFQSPEWEELDKELVHTGRLVPVYPLTQGLTAKWLRNRVKQAVSYWSNRLPDYLPDEARTRLKLLPLNEAIRQIHFPDDWDTLEKARRRLAFDELLMIQLGVLRQRQAWRQQQTQPIPVELATVERMVGALPFELTGAQRKALDDIIVDLQKNTPMSRLVQGDVGSGKTVVALAAMVLAVLGGGQAAILAPTEILAEQHFRGMARLLAAIGQALDREFDIRLLTGSVTGKARQEILEALAAGKIDILVGTHAVIQSKVEFSQLRLAVIDEQHRFGVEQRGALREKGFNPHLLVMTATPIPRTLALTLYGDLDLSIIDEMPPGRQPIKTRWLTPRERERAYGFVKAQVEKGRQAFIICPLVEETDNTEARAAIEEYKRLQKEVFHKLKLGLLHGRLKSEEKEKVMRAFKNQETQILVSTSVVEVGIDVPNATVMLIEDANRFGLAQLHQFRGRVGRGEHESYCLLLADKQTAEAEERLRIVEQTNNGFELAESDLKLRGPGEFFGTRQSGLPDLKLVQLTDVKLLELARSEAQHLFEQDPGLEKPEYRLLSRAVAEFWAHRSDLS